MFGEAVGVEEGDSKVPGECLFMQGEDQRLTVFLGTAPTFAVGLEEGHLHLAHSLVAREPLEGLGDEFAGFVTERLRVFPGKAHAMPGGVHVGLVHRQTG